MIEDRASFSETSGKEIEPSISSQNHSWQNKAKLCRKPFWKRWLRRIKSHAKATMALVVTAVILFRNAVAFLPQRPIPASPASTILLARDGTPLFASAASDDQWRLSLSADEINPDLLSAIVAVEDARFY